MYIKSKFCCFVGTHTAQVNYVTSSEDSTSTMDLVRVTAKRANFGFSDSSTQNGAFSRVWEIAAIWLLS